MAPTHEWRGKSGAYYRYYVYRIGARMKDEKGNYIYAKQRGQSWEPVYIGQGNLKDRSDTGSHHKGSCIALNGATHFHAHLNALQSSRRAEELDLQGLWPTPCND